MISNKKERGEDNFLEDDAMFCMAVYFITQSCRSLRFPKSDFRNPNEKKSSTLRKCKPVLYYSPAFDFLNSLGVTPVYFLNSVLKNDLELKPT